MTRRTVTCANPDCDKRLEIWRDNLIVFCSPDCYTTAVSPPRIFTDHEPVEPETP